MDLPRLGFVIPVIMLLNFGANAATGMSDR
jgi:hypothetical protein